MPPNPTAQDIPPTRVLSPPLGLIPANSRPELYTDALAHFTSIPWCAALLAAPPSTVAFVPACRNPPSPRHDQLFSRTLPAAGRGLRHMLSFFAPDDAAHARDPRRPVRRVSTLYALGDGLSGIPDVLHGGVTMALVDEAMGVTAEINTALGKEGAAFGGASVTGGLDISFLRPVPAEGVVCVTAWMEGVEGRKTRVRCEVKNGEGEVLARCSSTWVALRAKV